MFNQHFHQQQWWRQPRSQRSSQFTDKFGRRKPKLTLQIFVLPFTRYSLDFLFSVNTSAFRWALWRMFQVFGGLVWILVASTHVIPPNPLGWVMFVSVFCFVMTFLWMIIFTAGCHKNSASWAAAVRPGSRWVGPKSWGWEPHWPCDRVPFVSRTLLITDWQRFSTWAPQWSWLLSPCWGAKPAHFKATRSTSPPWWELKI